MHITFVKKLDLGGEPCRKCADVERRLIDSGYIEFIDEVAIADARDPGSPGMRLAARYGIDRAPFFLVEEHGEITVYTIYFQLVREVLAAHLPAARAAVGDACRG